MSEPRGEHAAEHDGLTIDVGYVHVGRYEGPHAPMTGEWVCAENCPHPAHIGSNVTVSNKDDN